MGSSPHVHRHPGPDSSAQRSVRHAATTSPNVARATTTHIGAPHRSDSRAVAATAAVIPIPNNSVRHPTMPNNSRLIERRPTAAATSAPPQLSGTAIQRATEATRRQPLITSRAPAEARAEIVEKDLPPTWIQGPSSTPVATMPAIRPRTSRRRRRRTAVADGTCWLVWIGGWDPRVDMPQL